MRAARWCLAVLALVALAGFAWTAWHRPLSFDAYYTYYQAQPGWSWGQALIGHWLKDNHPPLFYALVRLAAEASYDPRWLFCVNLGGAILAFCGGTVLVRDAPRLQLPAALLFIAMLGSFRFFADLSYLRSYSLQASVDAVIVFGVVALALGAKLSRLAATVLACAIILGLNIHIHNTIGLTVLLGLGTAFLLLQRKSASAWFIVRAAGAGLAIFVLVSAFQLHHWQDNTGSFADYTGFQALRALFATLRSILVPNGLLAVLAIIASLRLLALPGERPAVQVPVLLLAAAVLATCAVLAMIRLVMLDPQYMVLAQVEILFALAILAAALLAQLPARAGMPLIVGLAAISSLQVVRHVRTATSPLEQAWGAPSFLAEQTRLCGRQPTIHVPRLPRAFYDPISGPDAPEMTRAYLRFLAEERGLTVEPASSRKIDRSCPTVFWIMDSLRPEWSAAQKAGFVLQELQSQGFAVNDINLHHPQDDFIMLGR